MPSKRIMNYKRLSKLGSNNPQWKGDGVGYNTLHGWVKKNLKESRVCERCHKRRKLDLANKSGEYKREFSDWEWLCRKCHMEIDGRLKELIKRNLKWSKSRVRGICTIGNCKEELHGRGMCHKHYEYWRRKNKEMTWADRKFGTVCLLCGKRHTVFYTPGENLPKSVTKCDDRQNKDK